MADGELSPIELKDLGEVFQKKYGKVKMIPLKQNPLAIVVKTDNETAPKLKEPGWALIIGRRRIVAALTSGSIGKLKRRASGEATNGQVPQ
jgi:hypothetical protein